MPGKKLIIYSLVLFLLINTSYFWEGWLGGWNILVLVVFLVSFITLCIGWFYQFYQLKKGGFTNKPGVYLLTGMFVVLALIAFRPRGIINFESFEDKDVLVAGRAGVAGCTYLIKLKQNHTFYYKSVCFGVDKIGGTYTITDDTIRFNFNTPRTKLFKYGVLTPSMFSNGMNDRNLNLLKTPMDPMPTVLVVTKNDLIR